MDRGAWWAIVHGVAKSKKQLSDWTCMQYSLWALPAVHRRRRWHPTLVLLPGKSHGWRSLVGCSPWGCWESDTTERLHFHFSLWCIGEGNGNPPQCSCLENPRDGGAWWAAAYGVAQSQMWLKWLSSSLAVWTPYHNLSTSPASSQTCLLPHYGPASQAFTQLFK